jgi:hypothetical protein
MLKMKSIEFKKLDELIEDIERKNHSTFEPISDILNALETPKHDPTATYA